MSNSNVCPKCNSDMNGESIWNTFLNKSSNPLDHYHYKPTHQEREKEADRVSEMYGATRTKGIWDRRIGLEYDKDRIEAWRCPDCNHEWKR